MRPPPISRRQIRHAAWLAALCVSSAPLHAQEAVETIPVEPVRDEAAAAVTEESSAVQLDEIVVTATKREKSVREIPASITAFSGERLEQQGAQGMEDIVKLVPGVNLTAAGDSAARVTVRGISAQAGTNPTTGVLFGDLSFTDLYLPRVTLDPNPFDLQSVEVLKGPQGTLFGAGALNGAIRYVPQPPAFGVSEIKYFWQYTDVHEGDGAPVYGAAVNLPIGDELALRLVGFDRKSPGYIDDTLNDVPDTNVITQNGLRAILGWQPDSDTGVTLTYARQATAKADTEVADNQEGRLEHSNRPRASTADSEYDFADFVLRFGFDGAELISDSAWIRKSAVNSFDASSRLPGQGRIPLTVQDDVGDSETWSQELRLVSSNDDSRWQWVAGAFAIKQDVNYKLELPTGPDLGNIGPLLDALELLVPGISRLISDGGQPILASIDSHAVVEEQALFGEVTRQLGENWELTLGGRFYRTQSGGTAVQSGALLVATTLELEHVVTGTLKEDGFNPKLSLTWKPSHDLLAYAAASRGFRIGGIQSGFTTLLSPSQAPDFFKSDQIDNYELGLRTQWFDNSLRFDITAFYSDWTNPQTLQVESNSFSSYFDNAGGVESEGAEASLQWLTPLPGLSLNLAAAYTKTLTTEPFTAADGDTVAPGSPWPFAPRHQSSANLQYITSLGGWMLSVGVTRLYLGEASSDLAQQLPVFGYAQWDGQIGLAHAGIAWMPELNLNVSNATDERARSWIFTGGTYEDITYIRPRAITLRISGRF